MNERGLITLKRAAALLSLSPGTVREYLSRYRHLFGPPLYGRGSSHPRLHRFLRESEIRLLLRMRVKGKVSPIRKALSNP